MQVATIRLATRTCSWDPRAVPPTWTVLIIPSSVPEPGRPTPVATEIPSSVPVWESATLPDFITYFWETSLVKVMSQAAIIHSWAMEQDQATPQVSTTRLWATTPDSITSAAATTSSWAGQQEWLTPQEHSMSLSASRVRQSIPVVVLTPCWATRLAMPTP